MTTKRGLRLEISKTDGKAADILAPLTLSSTLDHDIIATEALIHGTAVHAFRLQDYLTPAEADAFADELHHAAHAARMRSQTVAHQIEAGFLPEPSTDGQRPLLGEDERLAQDLR